MPPRDGPGGRRIGTRYPTFEVSTAALKEPLEARLVEVAHALAFGLDLPEGPLGQILPCPDEARKRPPDTGEPLHDLAE